MKALIASHQELFDSTGNMFGYRVAQVVSDDGEFAVADDLFWVPCDDSVTADNFYYDPTTRSIAQVVRNTNAPSIQDMLMEQIKEVFPSGTVINVP